MYEFYWEDSSGKKIRKLMVIGCDKMSIEISLADYISTSKARGLDVNLDGWMEFLKEIDIEAQLLPDPMGSFELENMK